jgi:hypothetical protein
MSNKELLIVTGIAMVRDEAVSQRASGWKTSCSTV